MSIVLTGLLVISCIISGVVLYGITLLVDQNNKINEDKDKEEKEKEDD